MKKKILIGLLMLGSMSYAFNSAEPTMDKSTKKQIAQVSTKPVFFWEVKTTNGTASGYTNSEQTAKKTIKLLSVGSIVHSKIVEIYNSNK